MAFRKVRSFAANQGGTASLQPVLDIDCQDGLFLIPDKRRANLIKAFSG